MKLFSYFVFSLGCTFFICTTFLYGQNNTTEKWSYHFQLTSIVQGHPSFNAKYSGKNSLNDSAETALSLTSTLYLGRKLWKGAAIYFNPEIAGGNGLSQARGIAGFTNGEAFRIGDPAPALYIARLYFQQYIAIGKTAYEYREADANQLADSIPISHLYFAAGKFANADFFDNNLYSHDPRTQFLNWSLMSNGAWDYAANTRGYTYGGLIEFAKPTWALRFSSTLVPEYANGPKLDAHYSKAHAETIELEKSYSIKKYKGIIRLLGFRNVSKAPSYFDEINGYFTGADSSLDVINGIQYGSVKWGFGLNLEQKLPADIGFFGRASWNDGKTATWAFAEIDQTFSFGINISGKDWKRKNDELGLAFVANGISTNHREIFTIGGYGFMLGDGLLINYGMEQIFETYYSAQIYSSAWLSINYQFVMNPAYNKDRGPVNFFSARLHIAF